MKKITEKYIQDLLPNWIVRKDGEGFELETSSPAGEDVLFDIEGDDLGGLAKSAEEYYNGFDPEDHAAQIYHAKHYGSAEEQRFYESAPSGLLELLDDARWIDRSIWDVREALWNEWQKQDDDDDN